MRSSFKLYFDSLDVLDELTDEQAGKLFKAIREYERNDVETLDGLMKAVFTPFKNNSDRAKKAYNDACERNKANGLKGGRPKAEETENNPLGFSETEANPQKGDKDKKKDKDKDVNKETKKERLIREAVEYLREEKIIAVSEMTVDRLNEFYDYRHSTIKKPFKTKEPLVSHIHNLSDIHRAGIKVNDAISMMKSREWQTIELSFLKNLKPSTPESDPFGFGGTNA